MRFRITIRGKGTELRGYATVEAMAALTAPPGEQPYIVAASPADDDYDPFKEQQLRELHHFETEQLLDGERIESIVEKYLETGLFRDANDPKVNALYHQMIAEIRGTRS